MTETVTLSVRRIMSPPNAEVGMQEQAILPSYMSGHCDSTLDSDEELSVGSESPLPCRSPMLPPSGDTVDYDPMTSEVEEDDLHCGPMSSDLSCAGDNNSNMDTNKSSPLIPSSVPSNNDDSDDTNHDQHPVSPPQPQGRPLKFSIDNILRPEFGRTAVIHDPKAVIKCVKRPSITSVASAAKRAGLHVLHDTSQPIDLSKLGASPSSSPPTSPEPNSSLPQPMMWPAWVYCTRYSDRPSSGRSPRTRRLKKREKKPEEKRPRTAFTQEQLARLKQEFQENRYLTEKRRQALARDLQLNESQIKIWFQNKRAKIKKASGQKNPLALQLMAQGLYNHSTINMRDEDGNMTEEAKELYAAMDKDE